MGVVPGEAVGAVAVAEIQGPGVGETLRNAGGDRDPIPCAHPHALAGGAAYQEGLGVLAICRPGSLPPTPGHPVSATPRDSSPVAVDGRHSCEAWLNRLSACHRLT